MPHHAEDWSRYRRAAQQAPLLTAEHERRLLRAAQEGAHGAADEIIASHMRLVIDVASRHARPGLDAHDLIGEGVVGLLEAVRRFDLSHQTRFSSYAIWWIRACVRQYALANRRIVGMPTSRGARIVRAGLREIERSLTQQLGRAPLRAEIAQALHVREEDVDAVDRALSSWDVSLSQSEPVEPWDERPGPEALVAEAELHKLRQRSTERALATLSEREREVVCERLCEDDGKSLTDLGHELGVSRQRAGQILAGARAKLRGSLEQVA